MENATKALLIAAGVLIVILLIAFGMRIFNSTGDTSADAQQVGEEILLASTSAKIRAVLSFMDLNDEQAFVSFLKTEFPAETPLSAEKIRELVNIIGWRSDKVCGKYYNENGIHITSSYESSIVYFNYLPLPKGSFEGLNNLKSNKKYKLKYNDHRNGSIYILEY